MCNEVARRRPRTGVMIDPEQLEEVTEFKYLARLKTSSTEITSLNLASPEDIGAIEIWLIEWN